MKLEEPAFKQITSGVAGVAKDKTIIYIYIFLGVQNTHVAETNDL